MKSLIEQIKEVLDGNISFPSVDYLSHGLRLVTNIELVVGKGIFDISHAPIADEVIVKSMSRLERLATHSESVACKLMAVLWPYANDAFLHDICDSIDLWLVNSEIDDLDVFLQTVVSAHRDTSVREHFQQVLELRRSN